jgi:thioredoxin-like negative regulator of GroEL
VISAVAVLALFAVIAYTVVSNDKPSASPVPAAMPPQQQDQAGASMAQVQALQDAVNANPDDHAARLRLANLLHDNGMLTQAIDNYVAYLERHPEDPDARVDLGICYDQLALQDSTQAAHYFSLAVREMEAVAKQAPTHQPAAFNLGIVNLHMGNLEASNTWLKRAVEINRTSELGMRAEKILQQHSMIP